MTFWGGLSDLITQVTSIPWKVMSGSFFLVSETILSGQARTLLSPHERTPRDEDRDLALHRQIYLEVAGALHTGFVALGNVGHLKSAQAGLMGNYAEATPVIAKLYMVAQENTARAILRVATELDAAVVQLSLRRMSLDIAAQELNALDIRIVNATKERDRWAELMKRHIAGKIKNEERRKKIKEKFQAAQRRIAEIGAQKNDVRSGLHDRNIEWLRESLSQKLRLSEMMMSALAAMRRDLGMAAQESDFVAIIQASIARQRAALDAFGESVRDGG
ncbi:hypothetical protein [Rhodovastum atsumiense]|uniref:Uncharacterized protein n=1 Tax=Rhodovastum atsumiense TaxID=504468 RepID=A0A5M6ISA9_9PROT|nr:hypothetical protein [Rhodovastum atsumiense]KAA5611194.1 hypothetical protein F1189_15610 [Rhodovastum atsumiense]